MSKKSLFAEAIADAKDLKAAALSNIKAALVETFTPTLETMVNNKLKEASDEEEGYEEDDNKDADSEVDEAKKKKPEEDDKSEDGEDKPEHDGESIDLEELLKELEDEDNSEDKPEEDSEVDETYDAEEKDGEKDVKPMDEKKKKPSKDDEEGGDEEKDEELDEHAQYLKLKEKFEKKAPKEDKPEEGEEEKDVDEDIDVEALLKELGGGDEEDANHEDEVDEAFGDKEEAGKKKVKPMDEEDSSLKSLADKLKAGATGVIDDFKRDYEALKDPKTRAEWLQSLSTQIGRTQGVAEIKKLTAEMNEVNLLNAKYLYFFKTINENTTFSQEQKVRVLKQFDKCHTVKEVKLVYGTISESFKASSKKVTKKPIKESLGFASKTTGTAKKVLKESEDIIDPFFKRMRELAGLI